MMVHNVKVKLIDSQNVLQLEHIVLILPLFHSYLQHSVEIYHSVILKTCRNHCPPILLKDLLHLFCSFVINVIFNSSFFVYYTLVI